MRVLVVGSLPPPVRARAEALRTEVVALLAEGHSVEVVAPDPVATAHRYLIATGIPGCLQLSRMVSGFDSVVVQVTPGLPVRARAGQLERTLSLLAFSFALGRGHQVVIRLERLEDLPGGAGGRAALRVWRAAERIVVGDEEARSAFVTAVGSEAERLIVSSPAAPDGDDDDGGWGERSDDSAANVLALVRARAARERRALAASDLAHVTGWERLASPGIAMTESDAALFTPAEAPRRPGDLARSVLAAADRRPSLWRLARAARLARRSFYALVRRDKWD